MVSIRTCHLDQAKAGEDLIAYDDRKISIPLTERDRNDTAKGIIETLR